jgi:hypothetical protein
VVACIARGVVRPRHHAFARSPYHPGGALDAIARSRLAVRRTARDESHSSDALRLHRRPGGAKGQERGQHTAKRDRRPAKVVEFPEGIGSSGRIRTYNPPVNSVTQVFGLAGSRAGSSDGFLLVSGVRQKIGQRLARATHRHVRRLRPKPTNRNDSRRRNWRRERDSDLTAFLPSTICGDSIPTRRTDPMKRRVRVPFRFAAGSNQKTPRVPYLSNIASKTFRASSEPVPYSDSR